MVHRYLATSVGVLIFGVDADGMVGTVEVCTTQRGESLVAHGHAGVGLHTRIFWI